MKPKFIIHQERRQKKSYFATENDFTFFNNCTFSSIRINFDCLYKKKFDFYNTELSDDILESFDELRNMGYDLYLYNVPESQEVLEWLDKTFKYGFICNEEPTRYADLSDHWNTISRNIDTIKKNDILAKQLLQVFFMMTLIGSKKKLLTVLQLMENKFWEVLIFQLKNLTKKQLSS